MPPERSLTFSRQTLGEMSYQQKLQAYDLHCIRRESINVKDHLANIHDTTERINEELYAFTSPRLLEISNGIATTTDELQGMRSEVHTSMELVMRRLFEYKNDIIRSVELVSKRKGGARDVILGRKRKIVQSVRCAFGSLIFTTATATKNYHFSNFTTQTKRKNRTFMYFLPSFGFWSPGLAVSFASTPFQVSLSLPTRRYIPYGNKAFECCEKGDLTALRWMVESREILVSDIELDDGGSDKVSPRSRGTLLHVCFHYLWLYQFWKLRELGGCPAWVS